MWFKQFQRLKRNLEPESAKKKGLSNLLCKVTILAFFPKPDKDCTKEKIINHSHLGISLQKF